MCIHVYSPTDALSQNAAFSASTGTARLARVKKDESDVFQVTNHAAFMAITHSVVTDGRMIGAKLVVFPLESATITENVEWS